MDVDCSFVRQSHWSGKTSSNASHLHERFRCDDGDATMANGICDSGTCQGCPVLTGSNDCEIAAGTFDPVTQQCSAPTVKVDGTACDAENTTGFGFTRHSNTNRHVCSLTC